MAPRNVPPPPAPTAPPASVESIADELRSLAVDIASLTHDPANARKHDARNLDSIKGSLSLFGQRKPIVVRRQGLVVIAGNGTLSAAQQLGWKRIAAVIVDDDAATATAYGIADNRTAELAAWDEPVLGTLLSGLRDTPINMEALGFTALEQRDLIGLLDPPREQGAETGQVASAFLVSVTCRDEAHQQAVYSKLTKDGESCRVSST